jgi:hypothetical protein
MGRGLRALKPLIVLNEDGQEPLLIRSRERIELQIQKEHSIKNHVKKIQSQTTTRQGPSL